MRISIPHSLWLLVAVLISSSKDNKTVRAEDVARDDSSSFHVREILLNLYQATGGLDWKISSNWFQQRTDVCDWHGISCYSDDISDARKAGQIREVDLRGNHLVGTLPTEVFDIPYLERLQVDENPNLDVDLSGIQKAQFLTHLSLSNTETSDLSNIGGAFQSLQVLHITSLNLRGSLPDGLFDLTDLKALYANYNDFSGSISTRIGQLKDLEEIYLFQNSLSGQIPTEIGQCTQLEIFSAAQNAFSGSLPTELNRLTNLQVLALQRVAGEEKGEGISGSLPPFEDLRSITELYLENQRLDGFIDQNFLSNAPTSELVRVDLSSNQLSGTVPSSLLDKNFLSLLLADNQISLVSEKIISTSGTCPDINNWMGGDIQSVGCNAFLCPPGTFAPTGRATETDSCATCASNVNFWGQVSCGSSSGGSASSERQILVEFFNKMGGKFWNNDDNWLDPSANVCSWYGIGCTSQGRVESISLKNNGLTGEIPPSLFNLSGLKVLNLNFNSVTIKFDGISKASNLEVVDFGNIGLISFTAADELTSLSNLRVFSIDANDLAGDVPDALYSLTTLEEFNLSHNDFQGTLSTKIGRFTSLQRLGIVGNQFSGNLPTHLGLLRQLRELSAAENRFTGSIPTELNQLTNLESLTLHQANSNANIGGKLPSFQNLEQLTSLQIDHNSLTGTLPSSFLLNSRRLGDRIELGFGDNRFEGEIPSQWSRFDNLFIDLAGNKISGIPESLCNKNVWMDGDVRNYDCAAILCPKGTFNAVGRQTGSGGTENCDSCSAAKVFGSKLCGDEPAEGSDEVDILKEFFFSTNGNEWTTKTGWTDTSDPCSWYGITCDGGNRVAQINLSDNGLAGTPATSIFSLPSLKELYLSGNSIDFDFNGIQNAGSLVSLFLAGNGLQSIDGIDKAADSLLNLHLQNNSFKGDIPSSIFLLTNLRVLYMGNNQLSGTISRNLASLTNLEELQLYHNNLDGDIPVFLGDMTALRELNLAENNFEGSIPNELNKLTNLKFLSLQREGGIAGLNDVGINQGSSSVDGPGLTGPLPTFEDLPDLEHLYLGVNSLTGSIPFKFLDGIQDKGAAISVDITSNRLTGIVPGSLSVFDKMSLFVADNQITDIADGLCVKSSWMDGDVGTYDGCNGILCPAGTYGSIGRNNCQQCASGTNGFLGSFECLSEEDQDANRERVILEKFYREMGGDSWLNNVNWMDQDISICEWYGVTCASDGTQSVSAIHLQENHLVGQFPSDMYDLPNLQDLTLQGNDITFSFSGISRASNLRYLDLEYIGLTSLAGVEAASGLTLLRVDGNSFNEFPTQVFSLTNLEVLSLSENSFPEQAMPTELRNLNKLAYFGCSECGFTGPIPSWISTFTSLEYLGLDQNAFEGPLPQELQSIPNLKHLDLADQKSHGGGLTGSILSFSTQTQLSGLFLQSNDFSGEIPVDLLAGVDVDVEETVVIDLRDNGLTGAVPTQLSSFSKLSLYLAANQIDTLPESLCQKNDWNDGNVGSWDCNGILCDKGTFNAYGRAIGSLECLPCEDDPLDIGAFYGSTKCGPLSEHTILLLFYRMTNGPNWTHDDNWLRDNDHCTWYGITCHEDGDFKGLVKEIDLSDNNMEGLAFISLFNLEGLSRVDLQKNKVSILFTDIANAINLESLNLSETEQSSLDGIEGAKSLKKLHITNAKLTGPFPEEFFELTNLQELYLSHNDLSGPLPTRIGQLKALKDLYIFDNGLEGQLPSELGLLAQVQHFSLGQNKFSGTIPRQITNLPQLEMLSLEAEAGVVPGGMFGIGGGGLTGELPAFDNIPRLKELYLKDNSLTGTIPSNFLGNINNKKETIVIDLTDNALGGAIPSSLSDFDDMQLLLAGNIIHTIPDEICNKNEWFNGEMANGCDTLLCLPGTFNEFGRRVNSETLCEECTWEGSAPDYGSKECGPPLGQTPSPKRILNEFYDATGGSNWQNAKDWRNEKVNICDWYGITCETAGDFGTLSITEISLEANGLIGLVPSMIFMLPDLKKLRLGQNDINIGFNAIRMAPKLEELSMDETRVSNLDGIGKAPALKLLHLHRNSFGFKAIPEELYDLSGLTSLDLSDSRFGGTLSSSLGKLSKLQDLNLVGNDISGQIPSEIRSLTDLKSLFLSNNDFHGTLPESISSLISLEVFVLDNFKPNSAGITGPLLSFSTMPDLRELHLSENQLTGSIPSSFLSGIGATGEAIDVHLEGNQLVGTVPSTLGRFSQLNIELRDNLISGIGDGLCNKSDWLDGDVGSYECDGLLCPPGHYSPVGRQDSDSRTCDPCPGAESSPYFGVSVCVSLQKQREREILESLYQNTAGDDWSKNDGWLDDSTDICEWYGIACREGSTVESIDLGSNHLVGSPPTEIYQMPNLKFLWLYSNAITMDFEGISEATNLQSLLVDSTKITSLQGLGSSPSLVDVDLRFNRLTGKLPTELQNLSTLESFTCSDNELTGKVPEFSSNQRLTSLRLGNNQFTGTLPSFARHPELQSLDLSENKLVGSIPSDLLEAAGEQLTIYIDLSENRLTGTVPGELSRFTDLTLYLRDNKINAIDPSLCSLSDWNGGDVESYGCDAILCPDGTYSESGRASEDGGPCLECNKNSNFGSTTCGGTGSSAPGGVTVSSATVIVSTIISMLTAALIL